MSRPQRIAALVFVQALWPCLAAAQDEAAVQAPATVEGENDLGTSAAEGAGELTPAKGFDVVKTDLGSLNISFYGLARYVNQLPAGQTFNDHLGRERTVKARNDINWHRSMIWLSGFLVTQRLRYVMTAWSLPTTQQTLVFGNLQLTLAKAVTLGVGIGPNVTNRSMTGSHPFWASSDRQMAEEFFRGGFSSAFWLRGEPLSGLFYTASVNTNLSQLGITASDDSRDLAVSASLWWMPTTGEFGLRGGLADFEERERVATRFGVSAGHSREDRANQLGEPPNATQIRLSDGVFPFEEGALADGVTVRKLNYDIISVDAAAKYRGFSILAEYSVRRLSEFLATGALPDDSILDHGFFVEAMHMVIPKTLGFYAVTSYVFDEFERHPWEIAGGTSYFPLESRSWRVNLHVIRVEKSPTGSSFGFYTAGQSGVTLSLGTDILL